MHRFASHSFLIATQRKSFVQISRSNSSGRFPVGIPQGKGVHKGDLHSCEVRDITTISIDILCSAVFRLREKQKEGERRINWEKSKRERMEEGENEREKGRER